MTDIVTIRAIAAGGDGVATLDDGRTVFVPRSAPGDRIALTAIRTHARFARAAIGEVLEPGPDRVVPPCPHYLAQQCGGCQLMHLSGAAQARVKATIAGDALRRLGQVDIPDPPFHAATVPLHYRTKMTLALRDGRLGYHPLGEARQVFDLHECLLVEPAIRDLHAAVSARRSRLPKEATRVVFRRDREGGRHVVVETAGGRAWRGGEQLLDAADGEVTVWWHPEHGAPRAVAGREASWPATVFEQVNPGVAGQVREAALARMGRVAGVRVWDLYAGTGETTRLLAEAGARVESVELDRDAVALAGRLGPSGPRRVAGDVATVLPKLARPVAIITNPPRGGMAEEVTTALATSGAGRIVYISCDPATLARDLRRLSGSYALTEAIAFDQFPQTAHLEMVAVLERR